MNKITATGLALMLATASSCMPETEPEVSSPTETSIATREGSTSQQSDTAYRPEENFLDEALAATPESLQEFVVIAGYLACNSVNMLVFEDGSIGTAIYDDDMTAIATFLMISMGEIITDYQNATNDYSTDNWLPVFSRITDDVKKSFLENCEPISSEPSLQDNSELTA